LYRLESTSDVFLQLVVGFLLIIIGNDVLLLFDTSALRSGYSLREPVDFAERILNIMYANLDIDPETPIDEEPQAAEWDDEGDELVEEEEDIIADDDEEEAHDEL
jgi:heat shock protein beta